MYEASPQHGGRQGDAGQVHEGETHPEDRPDSHAAADDDIWIYDANGTLRTRLDSGNNPLKARALIFSGDCTRVISASASGLRIQSAPTP